MMSPEIYNELLDATISELERMKRHGARFITVEPETLKNLAAKTPAKPDERQQTVRPAAAPDRRTPSSPSALAYGPTSEARAIPSPASARPNPAAASTTVARTPEPDIVISTDAGKIAAFQELRDRALVCQKCPSLVAARKNVVFGVGNLDAELMFVGEAPGADEDEQGEPFVGKAGQLLTKIIQTMGLTREQVYIANILKCRPDTPGQTSGNRPPTPEEMERCLPYLRAQIDLIKPKAMVALGATAVEGLFGKVPGISITKLRGKWKEFRGIPVMPTYHPSYLLRPNVNNVKREAWEDMLQVMERLKIPISEKQRGYFTKSAA